ncbi:MAG: tRNA (N(6)-L-threonylcarbamoyladenosine(37)-C(2))-methylthiotransferase MtaB, partial [bacterium]
MTRKKLAIATLGCKLNRCDSSAIRESFEAEGYEVVPFGDHADVYVVNTCTVTGETDHQCRQLIRRAVKKKTSRGARVVVTGCYAQVAPEEVGRRVWGVDLIAGNIEKARIVELLGECHGCGTVRRVSDVFEQRRISSMPIHRFGDYTRAFLRIQDGCDRRCSYCIIPFGRGRSRSETPADALEQARRFAGEGYREIVLAGVHIGAYGRDLEPKPSLAELLRGLREIDGIRRIRLSSLDPTEFTPELLDAVTSLSGICRHLHIALQSGDDEILRRMRRPYRAADFEKLVATLHDRSPGMAVATDVIVGFPGEDVSSFERTFDFLRALPIASMHVFRFSPRPNSRSYSRRTSRISHGT